MENYQDTTMDLKQITSKCLDSPGYLLFAAIRTSKKDGGREVIDFQYRRYHLSLEDAKQASAALDDFIKKEIKDLIDKQIQEENGGGDNE